MPQASPPRSTHRHWLQIAGALAIVAFHCQAPGCQAGWVAVELFFVMAGIHMVPALARDGGSIAYLATRCHRLLPESLAVWVVVVGCIVAGVGTHGMLWFVSTSPLFLHNLVLPSVGEASPRNGVFGAMWFTGALVQLQLCAHASRRWWRRLHPGAVIAMALVVGCALRATFAWSSAGPTSSLPGRHAAILYCLPFTHVEALALGVLVGSGHIRSLGKLAPWCVLATLLAGLANHVMSPGHPPLGTIGMEFPPRVHFSHVWAYPMLALTAASLCSPTAPLAARLDARSGASRWQRAVAALAPLTFGVYCFHGVVLASGIDRWLALGRGGVDRTLLFAVTATLAFAASAAFATFRRCIRPSPP